jgi:hypothetical protein
MLWLIFGCEVKFVQLETEKEGDVRKVRKVVVRIVEKH